MRVECKLVKKYIDDMKHRFLPHTAAIVHVSHVLRGIAVTTCAGRTTLIDLGDFPSPFVFPIIGLQGGFEPPGIVYFIRRHTIAGTFAAFNTKTN